MRLLTYNILDAGTGRIDPLAEVIRLADADVCILQETWDAGQFHKLADRLHMDRFLAENPKNPKSAAGLLSRLPIRQAINHAPLDSRITRSVFSAEIEIPDAPLSAASTRYVSFIGLHLHARETLADEATRLAELPAILAIANALPAAHILAGDFNTSHPDQTIDIAKLRPASRQRIAQQNDQLPREVVTQILSAGYRDAHALFHPPQSFGTSFTTANPAMRVDFFFVTPALAPHVKSCEVFKPEIARFASDHFPVLMELA